MRSNRPSMTHLAAVWWGEMMVTHPNKRKLFCAQLEDLLREKEKTASEHEAVFVLGVGDHPHPLLAKAIENADLTKSDLTPVDSDDPIYMYLDFRDRNITVQTGYRAALRPLYSVE